MVVNIDKVQFGALRFRQVNRVCGLLDGFAVKLPQQLPQNSFGWGCALTMNTACRPNLAAHVMGYYPLISVTPTVTPQKKLTVLWALH